MIGLSLGVLSAPLVAAPVAVYAADSATINGLNCGANLQADQLAANNCPADPSGANGQGLSDLIKLVINVFSLIVGVVAVIMIIIGGLKYITSGGDSGNISGAKNTILYAIIGLVVVALAQFIVRFVLAKVGPIAG